MAEDRQSLDSVEKKAARDEEAEVEGHLRAYEPVEKKAGHDEEPDVEGHMLRVGNPEKKYDAEKKSA